VADPDGYLVEVVRI